MDLKLKADARKVLGKKVKSLRREGIIPAHIFGHNIKTVHVQVTEKDFSKIWQEAGETSIVDLSINSTKHPVLIRGIQTDPLTDKILHIDFYQVTLTEKVKVAVPLEIAAEAPAVEKKLGLLLTPLTEIEIEALPGDLPEKIEVDVGGLENVGDAVHVKDLKIDKSKIEVLTDPELVVANIGELVTKEAEEVLAEEVAEREAAEAVAAEGEAAPTEEVAGESAEEKPAEAGEEKTAAIGEPRPEGREEPKGS